MIAQQLFEGIELKKGRVGLITYMRTDSLRVASHAISEARKYIGDKLGKEYLPEKPRVYGNKKGAKEIALDSIKGTKKDKKVIKEASSYLAIGLINIINSVNPEVILIGGSVVKQDEILKLAKKEVLKKVLIPGRKTKILKSRLGNEATLVGAGLL